MDYLNIHPRRLRTCMVNLCLCVCVCLLLWHILGFPFSMPHISPFQIMPSANVLLNKTFICANHYGRLGNLMFQYASVYAIAKRTGKTPIYGHRFLELFPHKTAQNGRCSYFNIKKYEKAAYIFSGEVFQLPKSESVTICCYFLSWKYFKDYEEDIRREFTLSDKLKKQAQLFLSNIEKSTLSQVHFNNVLLGQSRRTRKLTFVGIHVRRGDKVWRSKNGEGETLPPPIYYVKAMEFYKQKYHNVHFVICSDDLIWCRQNLQLDNVTFCNGGSPAADLAILMNCNHSIISIGTFGWWAAWLAGGDVIYYHNITQNSFSSRIMDQNDMFKPHWMQIRI